MPALWTYPWTLDRAGISEACERLTDRGIDALNVASHYHSVRSMQPRFPDELFRAAPGGCYFEPGDRFEDSPIEPPVNDVGTWDDPLAVIVETAREHGVAVNAWTVCLHNSRLGASNPAYRIESAFGDVHDHSLCPSNAAVRDYFAAVVDAVTRRGVAEVQLESIGFPSVFHGHGTEFGHDKRQTAPATTEDALVSQCFCEACRDAAASHPVDIDRARSRVQELVRDSFTDPHPSLPPISTLLDDDPTLRSLFDFRATVVETLLERLADAAGSVPLNYYVMEDYGSDPAMLEAAGVDLPSLEPHLDRVTAMCYVADSEAAEERIEAVGQVVDLPIDVGVTLDPAIIDGRDSFAEVVNGVRAASDGALSLYHHSLATETHLDWIDAALEPS